MIRIKVIPLKKIIARIEISLLYFSLLLVLFLFVSLLVDKYISIEELNVDYQDETKSDEIPFIEINDEPSSTLQENVENENTLKNADIQEIANITESDAPNLSKEYLAEAIIEPVYQYQKPKEYSVKVIDNGKIMVGNTVIKNKSKIALDLNELKKTSQFDFKEGTSFLLYHTHTTESYEIDKELYTDNYRTQNEEYNMLKIGETLKDFLTQKGFICEQNRTVHDYPNYNGAYKLSLQTIQNAMKDKNYDVVIDLHRDAISSTPHYRLYKTFSGENVAQLMFVIGTNGSGVSHEHWIENLKLAIMIQNRAEEMFPGLFRELNLTNSRYNQHVSPGALLIEVGGTGNSIEEANNAMKYLADVINSMKQGE